MAIDEWNAKGGVLGRKIEWMTADTETNPATGTRIAERFITPRGMRLPYRGGAFGGGQRDHAGRQ